MKYAIKSIKKAVLGVHNYDMLRNELMILSKLDHPNIMKLYAVYEDETYLHMVTELLTGGELIEVVMNRVFLPKETEVAHIMKILLQAIVHM